MRQEKCYNGFMSDNVLTRGVDGAIYQLPDMMKGVGAMVTYSDLFAFVIMICAVITLMLNLINKK